MTSPRSLLTRLFKPFTRRLDVRIVVLFLGLLLLIQAVSFIAIDRSIDHNSRAQIAAELRTGENVLNRLLAQDAEKLAEASRLLASDYGFRSAIASADAATLVDALDNHGARIGASVSLFTDAKHRLVASTLPDSADVLALVHARARTGSSPAKDVPVQWLDGQPLQLVTVPVKAPLLIGHVSMGFPVGSRLARDVEQLSGLKMGLLGRTRNGPWTLLSAADAPNPWAALPDQLRSSAASQNAATQDVTLAGELSSARLVPLGGNATHEVAAVLLRSVDEAVAPYRRLQLTLLAITLAGLAIFAAGSVLTARRITGPIKALSISADRLGAGDYATPVEVTTRDEVRELAQSFEAMRQGMQQREAQIRRLAYWDPLTGLPNKEQFRNLLREQLAQAKREDRPCAVIMLDLDRFKHVNDVLGHAFGDRLLRQIALRLSEGVLRADDTVAHMGSDEFVVCAPHADADTAHTLGLRVLKALEAPFTLDDHTVDVGAGVGVATFPAHAADADMLMGRAEVAMYAAKARQSGVVVYDAAMDSASDESLSLLSELRTAVDHDQLRLFLQPKVQLASGRVIGAEALVRWQHPQRGMVAPMRFIPFAEQTGFIRVITGWMIQQCASHWRELRAQGIEIKLSVNLSTRDLLDQDLPVKLEKLLAREAVDPHALCLEITESAIMDDPQRALQTLKRLHDMGLRLSIDDFGTGYSSLAYLKQMPLHELKIDKSFVMSMERDHADMKIVRSTIDLAHNLGLTVTAEGIETAQGFAILRAMKCDEAQGYFMAKPMPGGDFAGWTRAWQPPQPRLQTAFVELI
ncbi:MAG: diguanylate phosphodiesterase [Methylibium sp. NZG]|nr:MAG: diguanylate phosphodiesterase [Methylibium sp. NZG]